MSAFEAFSIFAGHFGQGWYGLLQFQHVCAAGSNSRLAVIETTDV